MNMSNKYFINQFQLIGQEKLRRRRQFLKHMQGKLRAKQAIYNNSKLRKFTS